jgi:hypothetical protein
VARRHLYGGTHISNAHLKRRLPEMYEYAILGFTKLRWNYRVGFQTTAALPKDVPVCARSLVWELRAHSKGLHRGAGPPHTMP